jgi:hypothetical protein
MLIDEVVQRRVWKDDPPEQWSEGRHKARVTL